MQMVSRIILLLLPALRPSAGSYFRVIEGATGLNDAQAVLRDAAGGVGKVGGATDKGEFEALPSSSAAPKDKLLEPPSPHRSADRKSTTSTPSTREQPALNLAPSRATALLSNLLKMLQRRLGLGPKQAWTIEDLPERAANYDFGWTRKKPIRNPRIRDALMRNWVISSSKEQNYRKMWPYQLEEIPFLKEVAEKFDAIKYHNYSTAKRVTFTTQVNNAVQEMLKLNVNRPKDRAVFSQSLALMAYITNPSSKVPTQAEFIARRTLRNLYPELDSHLETVHAKDIQHVLAVIKNFHSNPSK